VPGNAYSAERTLEHHRANARASTPAIAAFAIEAFDRAHPDRRPQHDQPAHALRSSLPAPLFPRPARPSCRTPQRGSPQTASTTTDLSSTISTVQTQHPTTANRRTFATHRPVYGDSNGKGKKVTPKASFSDKAPQPQQGKMDKQIEKSLAEVMSEIKGFREDIKTELNHVKVSLDEVNKKLEPLKEKVDSLESKQIELENDFATFRGEISEAILDMKVQTELQKQYFRRENLIINGVPFKTGESPRRLVVQIANGLSVELADTEIVTAHRLPTKKGVPPIIAKLSNRDTKNAIIKASKFHQREGSFYRFVPSLPIICDEHLTNYTKEIFMKAKNLKKAGYLKFAWVKDGVVKIRERENSDTIKIDHISQLNIDIPLKPTQRSRSSSDQMAEGDDFEKNQPSWSQTNGTSEAAVNSTKPVTTEALKERLKRIQKTPQELMKNGNLHQTILKPVFATSAPN